MSLIEKGYTAFLSIKAANPCFLNNKRHRAEQIIKRIENDDFDNSDIDTLLIILRDSSKGFDRLEIYDHL